MELRESRGEVVEKGQEVRDSRGEVREERREVRHDVVTGKPVKAVRDAKDLADDRRDRADDQRDRGLEVASLAKKRHIRDRYQALLGRFDGSRERDEARPHRARRSAWPGARCGATCRSGARTSARSVRTVGMGVGPTDASACGPCFVDISRRRATSTAD